MKNTYIIAEAGVNHNGSLELAKKLIDVAAEAGADAVKFQTFKAEKLVSYKAPKAEYQKMTTNHEESQFEMIKKLELDEFAHEFLVEYCREKNIEFLSTPFDEESVDFLVYQLNLSRIKVSSGDLTNAPLLLKIARTKKPIILSTGMSTLGEIEQALGVLAFGYLGHVNPSIENFQIAYRSALGQMLLKEKVTLLHCTTEYPTPFTDVNLRVMDTFKQAFGLSVGFSDHTPGISVPIAAVSRGAILVEKHFTLDEALPGPDHKASLEPEELKMMIKSIREVEESLGSPIKMPVESELKNMNVARKSILSSKAIPKGEEFTKENLVIKRPGTGISPIYYWELLGGRASRNYDSEDLIEL
jgi:N-acetylneuraminate synthase